MKKFVIPFLALASLMLASCAQGSNLTDLRKDDIEQSVKDELLINFDDTNNSTRLETDDRTNQKTYYDVYVSNTPKTNLFTYNISFKDLKDKEMSFDQALETNRFRGVSVSTLIFNAKLYSEESTAIITEVYNNKYGITKADDNKISEVLGFEVKTSQAWTQQLNCDTAVKAYKDGNTDVKLQVVYMPIFVKRVNNGITVLKVYAFIPISYNFVNGDGSKCYAVENDQVVTKTNQFAELKNVELKFNPEAGKEKLLASKPLDQYTEN